MGPEAGHFFKDLGMRIAAATSDPLSHQYLLQHVVVARQWPSLGRQRGTLLLGMSSGKGVDCLLLLLSQLYI